MPLKTFKRLVGALGILLSLIGCSISVPSSLRNTQRAEALARNHHFQKILIKTDPFTLTSFQRFTRPQEPVTIYIEGDGQSWITRTQLSPNPTPRNPLALKLAVLDKSPNVAYLARPCQYTPFPLDAACHPSVWSDLRFSSKIIAAMNQATSQIKKAAKAPAIHLVGFSGGAAIAVLVAAKRSDILTLRTVAGDLDHQALSEYHQTTPLPGSLNPLAAAAKLARLPQHHFVGANDPVVPSFISKKFVDEILKQGGNKISQMVLPGVSHHQGWESIWPDLLNKPFIPQSHKLDR